MRDVPNMPKTPLASFRIPKALKDEAAKRAAKEGKTLTDVVVEALERYVHERD
jgi:predicted HicB family RNase H-like nuclease